MHINTNNTVKHKNPKNINSAAAGKKIESWGKKTMCCRPKTERTCQHCYKPACIPSLASFINTVSEWKSMRKNTPYICVYICKVYIARVFKPLNISVPNAYFCSNSLHHAFDLRAVPASLLHAFNSKFILAQQAANSSSIFKRTYYYFHNTGHRFTFSKTTAFDKLTSAFYFPTFLLI